MSDKIQLSNEQLIELKIILRKYLETEIVILFGSRVIGNTHEHSDLDIAIKDEKRLSWNKISDLREAFENSTFPFRIDFLDYNMVSSEFQRIIDKTGIVLNYSE